VFAGERGRFDHRAHTSGWNFRAVPLAEPLLRRIATVRATLTPLQDRFAPAQFTALSDDAKLSAPSFEETISGAARRTGADSRGPMSGTRTRTRFECAWFWQPVMPLVGAIQAVEPFVGLVPTGNVRATTLTAFALVSPPRLPSRARAALAASLGDSFAAPPSLVDCPD
jgi:hypothetical protein